LVGQLRQSLGEAWQDDWLAQGLHGVSREALPALLSDDPEAALAELQQRTAAQMPPQLHELLQELAAEGLEIRSQADLQRAMADRPDLRARLAAALESQSNRSMPDAMRTALQQAQQDNERYLTTGDQVALDAAVTAWERILDDPAFATSEEQFQATVRNNYGRVLLRRHLARGRDDDLNRALDLFQQAVAGTPPESAALPNYLNNLGAGLRERYQRTGHLEDLNEAIQVYRRAAACVQPDSPELPHYLNNLGIALSDRHLRVGQFEDIEEAIRVWRQAVAATPRQSPELPGLLTNLGNGLSYRYGRTGRLDDLDEAVQLCEQAVAATFPGSPQLPSRLYNVASRLTDRYKRRGSLEDMEQAMRFYRLAVERTAPDSPELSEYLKGLGIGLGDQYERTASVEHRRDVVERERCQYGVADGAVLRVHVAR
jgi:tetratricopeptide (TPR) repeat protein